MQDLYSFCNILKSYRRYLKLLKDIWSFYKILESYRRSLKLLKDLWKFQKVLTLSFTPYQTFIFLEILFKIRNQHKILRKKVDKKFYFLSKPLKIKFRTSKIQTLIKPVGNIFDRREPKKPPLNWSFPTKWYPCLHISLFGSSRAVHNNLA